MKNHNTSQIVKASLTCVTPVTDVCEGVACGPNAECVATDRQGVCECLLGYEGTPSDSTIGCRPTPVHCLVSADCPHNTYCYQQACRRE